MQGRLRIYVAGTGDLVYDSEAGRVEPTGTDESIKERFLDGERLYYDPGEGLVRCYLNLQRDVPEQCVASYEADPGETDDLLAAFRRAVESAVDARDWRVRTGAGGGQAVYNELGAGATRRPARPLSTIADVLGGLGGETFGAPDETAAARFVNHLDAAPDRPPAVAVGYGVPPAGYDGVTYVRADAPTAAVRPVGESYDALQRGLHRERRAAAEAARDDLLGELAASDADPAAYGEVVAEATSAMGFEEFDLAIRPKGEVERRTKNAGLTVAVATFLVAVAVGVAGLAGAGLLDGLPGKLRLAAATPDALPAATTLPSWQVLAATVLVGFASYLTWWRSRWRGGPFRVVDRATVETFRNRVGDLAEVDLAAVDSSLQAEVAALVEPIHADEAATALEVGSVESTPWYRRRTLLGNALFGSMFAVGTLLVLVESAGLREGAWLRLVDGAFWLAVAIVVLNVLRLCRYGYRRFVRG